MEKVNAIIESASIHKITDIFNKKPSGLKFNDTDAIIVTSRTDGGNIVARTFYFCLKPNGTFCERAISKNGVDARRQRLASFLKYYEITSDIKNYNIKQDITKWCGKHVKVVPWGDSGIIYVP